MKNYDPNARFGTHIVELTFQQWDHKLTVEVPVGGNCKGMSIIEAAIYNFHEKLYDEQGEYPFIIMFDEEGNELETGFEDEEELKDMLVSARILSFTRESK